MLRASRHLGSTSAHRLGERSSATSMARIVAPELNTIAVRGGELYSVLYSVHRNGQYGVCPSIQSSKVFYSSENPQEGCRVSDCLSPTPLTNRTLSQQMCAANTRTKRHERGPVSQASSSTGSRTFGLADRPQVVGLALCH